MEVGGEWIYSLERERVYIYYYAVLVVVLLVLESSKDASANNYHIIDIRYHRSSSRTWSVPQNRVVGRFVCGVRPSIHREGGYVVP
jgi:hypothetical protein